MLTGSQIRRKFLDFFVQKGHKEVHSSSLVPQNDPTLLFTNAGMNQFKDVFLGLEKRDYARATTSQKCVRAGGKHNDLENVGFTNRHHTFFEMLGNFSFGDYFKKDAIAYAWELITSKDWYGIDKEKLYVTIFNGEGGVPRDAEAYDLWAAQGVPKPRIFEMGLKDNFWQMGDTGPCGPCSEIHYDMGVAASDQGHTDCKFPCECGRYVEIWNLVFMQFDRDASGKLNPLPKPSIDTGMGLERVASVLQGVISNYETDLFTPLIKRAAELTLGATARTAELRSAGQPGAAVPTQAEKGTDHVETTTGHMESGNDHVETTYGHLENGNGHVETTTGHLENGNGHVGTAAPGCPAGQSPAGSPSHKSAASLRVIADHSRAATFLISDGVLPANDGRGYVLRKIIRRAITHGRLLGQTKPFLHEMVFAVRDLMQDAYPELKEGADRISKAVMAEEVRFAHTMEIGLRKLEEDLEPLIAEQKLATDPQLLQRQADEVFGQTLGPRAAEEMIQKLKAAPHYPGDKAFKLYDTYGLPFDFIEDAVRDRGLLLEHDGFAKAMFRQRELARASWKGAAKLTANPAYQQLPKSDFEGYGQTRSQNCLVLGVFKPVAPTARELNSGEEGEVVLDHTPFYADSGGQIGDLGWLYDPAGNTILADVLGCQMPIQGVRFHKVRARQHLEVNDSVTAVVNADIRNATMRNHTATHLLHAGLREVLGKHVKQAGSLVAPNHLRFDFSHFAAVEDEELQDIEDIINKEVLRNIKVETLTDVPIDEAISKYHAMALFGEKYGDKVRVVRIGDFSTELCGGTHTAATGEIGLIKILKEGSVSSGVRRVEAVTGEGSLAHFRRDHELEKVVSAFSSPTFAQKPRKDGAPLVEETPASPADALKNELDKKDAEIKRLTRELDHARMKSASSGAANLGDKIKEVKGVKVLAHRADNLERAQLRLLADQLRDKLGSGVVVLGSASEGNVSLIVGVTKDLIGRVQAGKVIGPIAQKVGGKGGGRPDLAEAGGKDAAALDAALAEVYNVVETLLG